MTFDADDFPGLSVDKLAELNAAVSAATSGGSATAANTVFLLYCTTLVSRGGGCGVETAVVWTGATTATRLRLCACSRARARGAWCVCVAGLLAPACAAAWGGLCDGVWRGPESLERRAPRPRAVPCRRCHCHRLLLPPPPPLPLLPCGAGSGGVRWACTNTAAVTRAGV